MRESFRNPSNGYVEQMPRLPWLKALAFGPFFFALRGAWLHAVIAIPLWAGGLAVLASLISIGFFVIKGGSSADVERGMIFFATWLPLLLAAVVHAGLARGAIRKTYLRKGWILAGPTARGEPSLASSSVRRH